MFEHLFKTFSEIRSLYIHTHTHRDGRTLKGKSMSKQNNNLVVVILSDEDRTQAHILTVCLPSG